MKFALLLSLISASAFAADGVTANPAPAPAGKATIAGICLNCHKAENNALRGHFDNITFKAKTIQLKIDDSMELLKFDEKDLVVVGPDEKEGTSELLKNGNLKKGHEIKLDYKEVDGVKTVSKLTIKPPVKIPKEMLTSLKEMEKWVAEGPEKGKFFLFDARPAPRFQEGTIPGSINLPFPAFDKLAEKLLPADKTARIIFYCSGVTCNMSPGAAKKAQKLGYTNIKLYKEGLPEWSQKHFSVLTAPFMKDAWIAKDISHILLDVRATKELEAGFIKGAVSFPIKDAKKLVKALDPKLKKAPVIVYDSKGEKDAITVANELVKAGFGNVKVITGGFEAWKTASFEVTSGTPETKITFVPKLRPGEIALDEFKKIAETTPEGGVIIDVRNADETSKGMIKNALNIPLTDLKARLAEIPKDKPVIFQCNTGTMAEMAFYTAKELGLTNQKYLNAKITFDKNGKFEINKE